MSELRGLEAQLFEAACKDDSEELRALLLSGVDVNTVNEWGWCALSVAAQNRNAKHIEVCFVCGDVTVHVTMPSNQDVVACKGQCESMS